MRAWLAFLVIVPACGFRSPSSPGDDASAGSDASPDVPAMQFGAFVQVQFLVSDLPQTPLAWNSVVDINTDTDATLCNPHNSVATRYCVVAATSISIGAGATLRAHGQKPLVLLATSLFDLQGSIDVSSRHTDPSPGAGAADANACQGAPAVGHSGGFGGSFGGMGGDGGTPLNPSGETPGMAAPKSSLPEELRGGCPGGNGAQGALTGGIGGSGGGAVAIIAPMVRISGGTINASGAGGLGGPASTTGTSNSGGGGGGSGGMIVIDTPSIMAMGANSLFANGGGGGQGGTDGMGSGTGPGADGQESTDPTTPAKPGAAGNRDGGSGGIGSSGTIAVDGTAAGAARNSGGGGAGGGGAGSIRSPAIAGASFAPTPTLP